MKDLKGDLGEQIYFVDVSYVKAATKTNKDARWSLSTWTHKAVRKAYKQFLVPRDRALEKFEKLENLNDSLLIDTEVISSVKLTHDIESAVKQIGLSLDKKNGTAVVTGTTFGKDKMLKDLGFVYNNNMWSMEYNNQEVKSVTQPIPKQSATTPAKELMTYLKDNGLNKEEIGLFVKDTLKLNSSDVNGIASILKDKDSLLAKVTLFLNPINREQSSEVNMGDIF